MNRTEYLQWAKDRALEYVKANDLQNAWASFTSDLQKHKELQGHLAINLGRMMIMNGELSTAPEMKNFIEGFN